MIPDKNLETENGLVPIIETENTDSLPRCLTLEILETARLTLYNQVSWAEGQWRGRGQQGQDPSPALPPVLCD